MNLPNCRICIVGVLTVSSLGASPQDTRLLDAAKSPNRTQVNALLSKQVDPNVPQADGATALHWAAYWNDEAMTNSLISGGAVVNVVNDFGVTPLWLACLNGNSNMVKALLDAGADANTALPSGETLLMTAARSGSAEAVRLLAASGANLDAREHSRSQTALMWAVAQRHPEVVRTLIDLGADIHIRSAARPRRIHTRTAGFNPSGVIDVVQGGFTALLFAARSGDLESARYLVAEGADVNDTSFIGTSALVVAAHSGHTRLAVFLLRQGADANASDAGYSALHTATLRGDQLLVKELLSQGAHLDTVIERGSPGRRNSPDYVLQHDVIGATAYWLAAQLAEPAIMRTLADHGADTHIVMPNGTNPLMAAIRARRRSEPGLTPNQAENESLILDAAGVAIEEGVDPNASDETGNTALHTAAARRLDSVIQLLVDNGADLNIENNDNQTPLALVDDRDSAESSTVQLLRTLGAINK